jgi:GNAT superfamily N-acetyltransferase
MIPIRPLYKEDRDAIQRLLIRSTPFNPAEIATAQGVIDTALDHPEKEAYSIYCAHLPLGDLLGFVCFGPIPMTDRCYDLNWIVVDHKFTGRGVGGELLLYMEETLVKKNGRRIYLDTFWMISTGMATTRSSTEKTSSQQNENYYRLSNE